MENIDDNVSFAYRVSHNQERDQYKIFYKTNENIVDLLKSFNFNGKNILTVMGSGDQVFHFLNTDAKNVDVYDKNILSKYYFYLRVWCIRYLNKYYLPAGFDNEFIRELLKIVEPLNIEEKNAYDFWNKYLNKVNNYQGYLIRYATNVYENTIMNLEKINEKMLLSPIEFYNLDITGDIDLKKKYDVVYVSNIREWIWLMHLEDRIRYKDNLFNLLNDDGVVICSTLDHYPVGLDEEQSIFKDQFSMNYIDGRLDADHEQYRISPGYYYKKKK